MRLQNYSVGSDVYVHQVSETTTPPAHVTFGTAMSRRYTPRAPEVCVTTEEIVVEDYPYATHRRTTRNTLMNGLPLQNASQQHALR